MRTQSVLLVILVVGARSLLCGRIALSVGACRIRPGTLCTSMNLTGAKLNDANLAHAQFTRSVLAGADLSGANLDQSDLSRADLRKADLHSASLLRANARGARFDEANLGRRHCSKALPCKTPT